MIDIKSQPIGSGIECRVFNYCSVVDTLQYSFEFADNITINTVIKIYKTYEAAKSAYNRQKLAASHKLAPKVYDDVIETADGFGYISEKVRILSTDDYNVDWCFCPSDNNDDLFLNDYYQLEQDLTDLFGSWSDLHIFNLGYDENDRLVAIDFGDNSCST